MRNPLKEFFSPRFVVGLEVTSKSIGVVQVNSTLKGPEINKVVLKEVKNAEQIESDLKALFDQEGLRYDILVTCLPGSAATVRRISLPFGKSKKLDRIIKYQTEPYVPYPIEDMIVDFLPPDPDGTITTIGVQKKVLSEHLGQMSRAGIQPDVVSLDSMALFSLSLCNLYPEANQSPVGIVHFDHEEMAIQVVREGRLEFLRILDRRPGDLEQIENTFRLYSLKEPSVRLNQVLLIGDPDPGGGMAEKMSSLLNVKATPWRPFDHIKHTLGDLEDDMQARLSVPLGLALSVSNQITKTVNLRKEEFRVASHLDLRKTYAVMLSAFLLLVIIFTFGVYQKLHYKESVYDDLRKNVTTIFRETFPSIPRIVKGQELVQMKQKIGQESARFKWLEDMTGKRSTLEVLGVLTQATSGFEDVRFDNISVDENEVRIDGRASTFETVDKLKERLSGTKSFESVKLAGAKTDKKDNVVKFSFGLEGKK